LFLHSPAFWLTLQTHNIQPMKERVQYGNKTFERMLSAQEIESRIVSMAKQINTDYAGKEIVMMCVLKGSILFSADLMRHIQVPVRLEFIRLSSYGSDTQSSGKIQELMGAGAHLEGKHILVVEDIVDSGLTLDYLRSNLKLKNVASAAVITLLYKPGNFKGQAPPDYYGFEISDEFVIGYGMDIAEEARQLESIYQLVP